MLVGRLPLHSGSIAGCCIGVAKSMCSVMLENGDDHISHRKSKEVETALITSGSNFHMVLPHQGGFGISGHSF